MGAVPFGKHATQDTKRFAANVKKNLLQEKEETSSFVQGHVICYQKQKIARY